MAVDKTTTKVITGKVRLSYAKIWEAEPDDNGILWFSTSVLIPKSDKETLRKIKAAVDAAIEQGKSKWGGKIPSGLKKPLHDGDDRLFLYRRRLLKAHRLYSPQHLCGQL
ncbi:MAG: ssDNA-binding protein [Bacillota bacterium]